MGQHACKYEHEQSIKNKLRNAPFSLPSERDYAFLSSVTRLDRAEVQDIVEQHLAQHADGCMNRHEFCQLYTRLRRDSPQLVAGLSENVFRALGVSGAGAEADRITLREFLMVYALTSPGDLRDRLAYAFDFYDVNGDDLLSIDEVRQMVYGIIELFDRKPRDDFVDIARDCVKSIKLTEVVRKDDFIDGMMSNKDIRYILSPPENEE